VGAGEPGNLLGSLCIAFCQSVHLSASNSSLIFLHFFSSGTSLFTNSFDHFDEIINLTHPDEFPIPHNRLECELLRSNHFLQPISISLTLLTTITQFFLSFGHSNLTFSVRLIRSHGAVSTTTKLMPKDRSSCLASSHKKPLTLLPIPRNGLSPYDNWSKIAVKK
jgi:hypothetical protein